MRLRVLNKNYDAVDKYMYYSLWTINIKRLCLKTTI